MSAGQKLYGEDMTESTIRTACLTSFSEDGGKTEKEP
jgi:hypothetical protein